VVVDVVVDLMLRMRWAVPSYGFVRRKTLKARCSQPVRFLRAHPNIEGSCIKFRAGGASTGH